MKFSCLLFVFCVPFLCVAQTDLSQFDAETFVPNGFRDASKPPPASSRMMCTAMPALMFTSCGADDRTDGMPFDQGRIQFGVIGGVGPTFTVDFNNLTTGEMLVGLGDNGNGDFNYDPVVGRDLDFGSTTVAQNCIQAGMIEITVTDGEGCEATCVVSFLPSCTPFVFDEDITDESCNGPGSIVLSDIANAFCPNDLTNGAVDFEWTNSGGATVGTSQNLTGVPAGDYTVMATDFYGCTGSATFTINSVAGPAISDCEAIMTTAPGASDGGFTFVISNGSPPFTVEWSGPDNGTEDAFGGFNEYGGISGLNVGPLRAGDYFIEVTDDNGCSVDCEVTIEDPDCTLEPLTCSTTGLPNGSVSVEIDNGDPSFDIFITGDGNLPDVNTSDRMLTLTGFTPGEDYTIEVVDQLGFGCSQSCMVTIPNCGPAMVADSMSTNLTCFNSLDGAIDIDFAAGSPTYTYDWTGPNSFTASTEDISGLVAGAYQLSITGAAGCPALPAYDFFLTQPDTLIIDCSATQSGFMADNGTISVDITGGTPPYRLNYNGTIVDDYASGTTVMDVAPAMYNIVITDDNGCQATCMVEVTEISCLLTVMPTLVNPACPDSSSGSISLLLDNVDGDSTIMWSVPGFENQTVATGLAAGDYYAVVGDDACVLDTIRFTLTDPLPLSVEISQVGTLMCHGDSTVQLTTALMNGVGPFSYNWIGTTFGDVDAVNMVPAGEYILEVTDFSGCMARDTIVVTQPADLTLTCVPTGETTSAANDGIITLNFTGAGPFNISGDLMAAGLTLADAPFEFTGLMPGSYDLTITDANGCTESCTSVVNMGGCIMTLENEVSGFDCPNPTEGSIRVTPVDGVPPYTYAWTNTTNTDSIAEMLTAGQYTVIVTDGNNCTAQFDTTLVDYTAFPTFNFISAAPICTDACQDFTYSATGVGRIEVRIDLIDQMTDALLGFFVLEVPASTDGVVTVCPADFGRTTFEGIFFRFIIVDDDLCEASLDIEYTPQFFAFATDTIRQNFCVGDTPTFGGMVFSEMNPDDEITLAGQSVNGCDSLLVVDLTFFDVIPSTIDTTVCIGGSVNIEGEVFDVNRMNGTFTSATPSALGCDSSITVNLSFHPEATSIYTETLCADSTVTIEGIVYDMANNNVSFISTTPSVNGCDSTVTVNLTFLPAATGTYTENICPGGTTMVEGTTYSVADNGMTFVSATQSASGCDSTVTINLIEDAPVTGTYTENICDGGTTMVEGTTYSVADNGTTFVSATQSASGCDSTVTINLIEDAPVTGTYTENICDGGTTMVEGTTYSVADNGTTFVSATQSASGCDSTVTINLIEDAPVTGTYTENICDGGTTMVEGTTYSVADNGTTFVSATQSASGCDSTVTINLIEDAPVTGTYTENICDGGTTMIEGTTYSVADNGTTFVSATQSASGCDSTVTINLIEDAPVTGVFEALVCEGESIMVEDAEFDITNNGSSFISATPSASGCDSTVTVNLTFQPRQQIALVGIEGGCGTDTYTLIFTYSGSNDVTMLLANVDGLIYDLPAGETRLEVVATGGDISIIQAGESLGNLPCELDASGVVSLPQIPALSILTLSGDGNHIISCNSANDGSLSAELIGANASDYTLFWEDGTVGPNRNGLSPGTYTVTAENAEGCSISETIEVTEPAELSINTSSSPEDCIGNLPQIIIDTITGGSGPYLYRVDGGNFITIDTFPFVRSHAPGNVRVDIQDINGCETSTDVSLASALDGRVNISPEEPVIFLGDSVLLRGQTNLAPDQILWLPSTDTAANRSLSFYVSPTQNTTYTLTVIDENGCNGTAEVFVRVDRQVPIFAPSAFSPNGDGINDVFAIFGERGISTFRNLMIFNRWGESVYEASGDLSPSSTAWHWDGKHRGEILNPGVFIYMIEAVLEDGRTESVKGEVVLLR